MPMVDKYGNTKHLLDKNGNEIFVGEDNVPRSIDKNTGEVLPFNVSNLTIKDPVGLGDYSGVTPYTTDVNGNTVPMTSDYLAGQLGGLSTFQQGTTQEQKDAFYAKQKRENSDNNIVQNLAESVNVLGNAVDPFNTGEDGLLRQGFSLLDVTDTNANAGLGNIVGNTGRFVDPFNTSADSGAGNLVRNADVTDPNSTLGSITVGPNDTPISTIVNSGLSDVKDSISGGGGDGGGGDGSNVAFNKLWPYKQGQLDAAKDLFNSGDSLNPNFSGDTKTFIDRTRSRATNGSPVLSGATDQFTSLYGKSDPSLGLYGDFANGAIGQNNPALDGYNTLEGRAGNNPLYNLSRQQIDRVNPTNQFAGDLMSGDTNASNPSTQFYNRNFGLLGSNRAFNELEKTSRGEYLNNNPYLDQIFNQGSRKLTDAYGSAMDKINSSFNLSGGFGSSARKDALTGKAIDMTDSLGNLYANIYGGNYQQERGRQLGATGTLGGFSDTSINRIMGGVDRLGTNYNKGIDRNVQGAGMLDSNYRSDVGLDYQGINNIGNAYNADTNLLSNINEGRGKVYNQGLDYRLEGGKLQSDAYNSDFTNTRSLVSPALDLANQDYTDLGVLQNIGGMQDSRNTSLAMEPWQKVGLYGDAIGGVPSNGGQPQQGGNPLMGALGGAAAGSALGWPGVIGGGILGYFGSR